MRSRPGKNPTVLVHPLPRWVIEWIVIVLLLSSLPYIVGLAVAPDGKNFTGNLHNATDTNSYFANMKEGAEGLWLYSLPYTAQRSTPLPLYVPYLLLGKIARLTTLSIPLVYHLARIAFGGLFALLAYCFFAKLLPDETDQKLALFILLFTGGIGWLIVMIGGVNVRRDLIPDLWHFGPLGFGSIMVYLHFTANVAFMLWMLLAGDIFITSRSRSHGLQATAAGLGIAAIHANQLAVVGTVLGIMLLIRTRPQWPDWGVILRLGIIFVPAALITAVLYALGRNDPYLAQEFSQVAEHSLPVESLFFLYGPVLVLALIGLGHTIRTRAESVYPAAIWFVAVFVFSHIPFSFQSRFPEGRHVPIAVMAVVGWRGAVAPWLRDRLSPRAVRPTLALVLGSVAISPIFLLAISFARVISWDDPNYYLDSSQLNAAHWLDDHAHIDDVVLSSDPTGNWLPAYAGLRVFVGHWGLTAWYDDRVEDVARFFDASTPDSARIDLLRRFAVTYLYVGPDERAVGNFDPDAASYLERVYSNPSVDIYRVMLPLDTHAQTDDR